MTVPTVPATAHQTRLRIALLGGRGLPSTYSGYETFFLELAPRLVARGHEVTVYCRSALFHERPAEYRGVKLVYLPSIETKNLGTFTHTLLSVVHVVCSEVDAALVVNVANAAHCIVPRLFGLPCALNVDGVEWIRGKWGRLGKAYFYWSAKLCGSILPRGIVTDSEEMRKLYLEEFSTPSACIAYGANIERSEEPGIVRQYGFEPREYYLIASRLVPENNAALIVDGFTRSTTKKILAIAGEVNYRSPYVAQLKASAGERVRFLGHVDSVAHIKELHCNAFAYLHGHTSGGTNPALLKAMGFGNCIVAHNNRFNKEVLAGNGLLFSDADELARQISQLETDPKLADDLRRRAPERIRNVYSWERITDQYEELFYQLAEGRDPTREHSTVITAQTR